MKYIVSLLVLFFVFQNSVIAQTTCKSSSDSELVVLIPGLARTSKAMNQMANWISDAGFRVEIIGYNSITQNIDEIKEEVFSKINTCCFSENTTVHFVGHSIGGLLIRSYLGENKFPNLGRVVLLGSPNKGLNYDNAVAQNFINRGMKLGILKDISSDSTTFISSLKPPDYDLGVIAGDSNIKFIEAFMQGPNDGLVLVESTKIDGMKDFVKYPVTHAGLRHDRKVSRSVINFLRNGEF